MAYSTPKLTWVNNEVVTIDDLNRLEGNAEAAAKPSLTVATDVGLSYTMGSSLGAGFNPGPNTTISHTSYTGRVKITAVVTVENTAAAIRQVYLSFSRDYMNVARNKANGLFEATVPIGHYETMMYSRIVGDVAIGVATNFNFMLKTAALNVILRAYSISIEDT